MDAETAGSWTEAVAQAWRKKSCDFNDVKKNLCVHLHVLWSILFGTFFEGFTKPNYFSFAALIVFYFYENPLLDMVLL